MLRGAVVVALLSQLSQQCGAALVRVRDERSRSTRSHEWLPDAHKFLRVSRRRPRTVLCWARLHCYRLCARRAGLGRLRNNTGLSKGGEASLPRRGRLDAGDLHDDGRLLELVQRRRRVEDPLQRFDELRHDDAVLPHLDDLGLRRERPRGGEARRGGPGARGRDKARRGEPAGAGRVRYTVETGRASASVAARDSRACAGAPRQFMWLMQDC